MLQPTHQPYRRTAVPAVLLVVLATSLLLADGVAGDQRAESSTWQVPVVPDGHELCRHARGASRSIKCSDSNQSSSKRPVQAKVRPLKQHPSVLTLSDLGIWSTEWMGTVPLAASAAAAVDVVQRHPVPKVVHVAARALSAVLSAAAHKIPLPGSTAVLLRHWWRLRCSGSADVDDHVRDHKEHMDLRGLGTAMSAADWVFHHQITSYVPTATAALNITDDSSQHTWTLAQSDVVPGIPSGWHTEARGLSAATSYTLTSASGLSSHAYSLDASHCSADTSSQFPPNSMWSVITASQPQDDPDLFAHLVVQHTSFHQQLGFTGAILMVTRPIAAQLLQHPAIQPGLEQGAYVFILWEGDLVPGEPYYHQSLWHNLVLLATWGVPGIKLAFIDLDEFYVLPHHKTFQEAFAAGGCMSGLAQARIMRVSAYYGITAAQAAGCPDSDQHAAMCRPHRKRGDLGMLAQLGWRRFFSQPEQYVDARFTIPEAQRLPHRWAHKSIVDPNHVAAYSIHEAGLILPGGGVDSQQGLPLDCALGLHLVNLIIPRMYGEGAVLALNGTAFDMPTYVQAVASGQRYTDLLAQRTSGAARRATDDTAEL